MFTGDFSNAMHAGKFVNACLDLYKKLGDVKVISKTIINLFPIAYKFFFGKEWTGSVIRISEDELRAVIVEVFKLNTSKFITLGMGGNYELYKPMSRELGIEHRKDLKTLLSNMPKGIGIDIELENNLKVFRELL